VLDANGEVVGVPNDGTKFQIGYIVDKHHVSTPDNVIYKEVYERVRTNSVPIGSKSFAHRCATYGVSRHHENRKLYWMVMSGRFDE
jgi:hypothetical protein